MSATSDRTFKLNVTGFSIGRLVLGCMMFWLGWSFILGGTGIRQDSLVSVLELFGIAVACLVLAVYGHKYEDRPLFGHKNIPAKFCFVVGPIASVYFGSKPFLTDSLHHEACAVAAVVIAIVLSLKIRSTFPTRRTEKAKADTETVHTASHSA